MADNAIRGKARSRAAPTKLPAIRFACDKIGNTIGYTIAAKTITSADATGAAYYR